MPEPFKFETLNTSYVNLAALIRYLREQDFRGNVRVKLDQYEASVLLFGSQTPHAWEIDHATGRVDDGEAAMQRLLVRSREPDGLISVEEFLEEESSYDHFTITEMVKNRPSDFPAELDALAFLSTEIIAVIERAVQSTGISFADQFHIARVEIGDDYPFLDPSGGGFEYEKSKVTLLAKTAPSTYVQAISEALKRVVNQVAKRQDQVSFRERVAVELALAARRLPSGLGEFTTQLDRIAGAKVL